MPRSQIKEELKEPRTAARRRLLNKYSRAHNAKITHVFISAADVESAKKDYEALIGKAHFRPDPPDTTFMVWVRLEGDHEYFVDLDKLEVPGNIVDAL